MDNKKYIEIVEHAPLVVCAGVFYHTFGKESLDIFISELALYRDLPIDAKKESKQLNKLLNKIKEIHDEYLGLPFDKFKKEIFFINSFTEKIDTR